MSAAGLVAAAAGVLGRALAEIFGVLKMLRPRPLHPHGVVLPGVLVLDDPWAPGVDDLGGPSTFAVQVRLSRAVGLPAWLPDNQGLALRWDAQGRHHDVLLASSGLSRTGRFLLLPRRCPMAGPFTTLMPFTDTHGRHLLVAAVPAQPAHRPDLPHQTGATFTILTARATGPWWRAGTLVCPPTETAHAVSDDPQLRFDPIGNVPGALRVPAWAAQVRRPVYARSRS